MNRTIINRWGSKRIGILAFLSIVGSGVAIAVHGAGSEPPQPFPTTELQSLDRDVQARFAIIVRSNFGMSRIVRRTDTHALYHPDTPDEVKHVTALKSQGQDVLFYVLGRNGTLEDAYTSLLKGPGMMTGPANKMPVDKAQSITLSTEGLRAEGKWAVKADPQAVDRHDLPRLLELQAIGQEALKGKDGVVSPGVQRTLADGGWTVVAVPIPASTQRCVVCHARWEDKANEVALGKPLGAAIYAYRTLSDANSPVVVAQAANAQPAQQQVKQAGGG